MGCVTKIFYTLLFIIFIIFIKNHFISVNNENKIRIENVPIEQREFLMVLNNFAKLYSYEESSMKKISIRIAK